MGLTVLPIAQALKPEIEKTGQTHGKEGPPIND
jgi:hypothetical protein